MKYLKNGQAVEVLSEVPGVGFVVDPYLEDQDTGVTWLSGSPKIVRKVYDSVPIDHLHAEYKSLQDKIDAMKLELAVLSNDMRDSEKERKRILERLNQLPHLKRIEDFIDGKFTHVVVEQYGKIYVKDKESLYDQSDRAWRRGPGKIKLVTLFGDSAGNLEWNINRYTDGSGFGECVAFFCQSEEEAKNRAAEIIAMRLKQTLAEAKGRYLGDLIESAERIGIEVEEQYLQAHRAASIEQAKKEHQELVKKTAEAEKKLCDLERCAEGVSGVQSKEK